jgi:hypothetical protein
MTSRSDLPADRDTWRTPLWLAELVAAQADPLGVELDPCGHLDQHVRAERIAVRGTWSELMQGHARLLPCRYIAVDCGIAYMREHPPTSGVVWCNPPYSDPAPWIEALLELEADALVLCNTSSSARWYQRAMRAADSALLFGRRIAFDGPRGPVRGNRHDQTLFRLGHRWGHWTANLEALGTIVSVLRLGRYRVSKVGDAPARARRAPRSQPAHPSRPHGPAGATPAELDELEALKRRAEVW